MRYILVLSCAALTLVINLAAGAEIMDTPGGADKVFVNGKIITMNDQQPEAQAVALQAIISQLGSEKLSEKKDHPGKSCEEAHPGKEHKRWEDENH